MAFEGLTEKISSAFKHLRSKGRLTESDVKEAMREIRMALLEADVNFKVAKDFIKAVTRKGDRRRDPREPVPGAAGHQDRQRGADRPARRAGDPSDHSAQSPPPS